MVIRLIQSQQQKNEYECTIVHLLKGLSVYSYNLGVIVLSSENADWKTAFHSNLLSNKANFINSVSETTYMFLSLPDNLRETSVQTSYLFQKFWESAVYW